MQLQKSERRPYFSVEGPGITARILIPYLMQTGLGDWFCVVEAGLILKIQIESFNNLIDRRKQREDSYRM